MKECLGEKFAFAFVGECGGPENVEKMTKEHQEAMLRSLQKEKGRTWVHLRLR